MADEEPRRGGLVEHPFVPDAFVRLTGDEPVTLRNGDSVDVEVPPIVDGVFEHNSFAIRVSREMAIDYGLVDPTPEEVAARAAQRAATERSIAEQRAQPGPDLTLHTLLERLEWSPAYARHWLHPACWCYPFDEDPILCSWARELGFTKIGGNVEGDHDGK